MLQIVDKTGPEPVKNITLNEIPVGTTFRGRIRGGTGTIGEHGLFYKMSNRYCPWTRDAKGPYDARLVEFDVLVIRLDTLDSDKTKVFPWCREVLDYEPLKATLMIERV